MRLGELEGRRGTLPAALRALGGALALQPEHIPARLLRTKVAEDAGNLRLLDEDVRWLTEHAAQLPDVERRIRELASRERR